MSLRTKPILGWLFEADFSDGTTYYQDPEDTSLICPQDESGNGKSAFYDVRVRMNELERFHLVQNDNRVMVDLNDGHFEINGLPISLSGKTTPKLPLELLYLRNMRIEEDFGGDGQSVERRHYVASYVVGWKDAEGAEETVTIDGDRGLACQAF